MAVVEFTANVTHNGVAHKVGDVVNLEDGQTLIEAGLAKEPTEEKSQQSAADAPVEGSGQVATPPLAPAAVPEPDGFPLVSPQPTPQQIQQDIDSIEGSGK